MFPRSIKQINKLISKRMSNIYINSSHRENLTFSKLRVQVVVFKPLSYCFKEAIGFEI